MMQGQMLKGFTHARLACGCRVAFREGVEGSPVTVVVDHKSPACTLSLHVRDSAGVRLSRSPASVHPARSPRRRRVRRRRLISVERRYTIPRISGGSAIPSDNSIGRTATSRRRPLAASHRPRRGAAPALAAVARADRPRHDCRRGISDRPRIRRLTSGRQKWMSPARPRLPRRAAAGPLPFRCSWRPATWSPGAAVTSE